MSLVDPASILVTAASRPLTLIVFFRGSWCPFCQAYLRELDRALLDRVTAVGGAMVGVTSQSAEAAARTHRAWSLRYPLSSEPENTLAQRFGVAITPKEQTPLSEHPTEYPHGMSQPAVIALNAAGDVLYRWAIDPSTMNLGGATDRPLPDEVWAAIEAAQAERAAPAPSAARLDVGFLAENYPEQHQAFEAWVASMSS